MAQAQGAMALYAAFDGLANPLFTRWRNMEKQRPQHWQSSLG
jgi:hypothetical protein